MKNLNYARISIVLVCALIGILISPAGSWNAFSQQPASGEDKDLGRSILSQIKDGLKKNYYDPNFHGMDLDTRFKTADEKIKQATTLGQIFGIIAQVLVDLDDSHTSFLPPGRVNRTEYGWYMQMVGDKCYVNAVKPGSDAEAKGLRLGDQVLSIDGTEPNRQNLWKINYAYRALRPRIGMRLVVAKPDGKQQQIDVLAKVTPGKQTVDLTNYNDLWILIKDAEKESRVYRHRYIQDEDVFIWKMPQFDLSEGQIDDLAGKFRKKKGLILDLRGNSGGYEETLLRLLGNVFPQNVNLGEIKRRKETKPLIAKSRGEAAFAGKLIVLIDSQSASSSELFARVVQLEKRGTVIGDVSAGAVMRSIQHTHQVGGAFVKLFGVSITDADVVMTDGKSLERVGVTPDEIRLPLAIDMAANRDPVLAYAASLLGVNMSPEKAGSLFPLEWLK
jgi:C-terminal processing protease CtpA/Prc